MNTGVLGARAEDLDSVEPWVEHLLAGKPPHIAALVRPYVSWSVLRRVRSRAARTRVTRSVRKYARARIGLAVQFLTWLDARGQVLATATQADVDVWLAGGTTTHYRLRDFLRWAHARRLCGDVTIPWLGRDGLPEHVLSQDDRWGLLRRCLQDEGVALHLRVAGALVLLYGQVPSRIVELTRDHLTVNGSGTYLAFGRQPVLLPPPRSPRSSGNSPTRQHPDGVPSSTRTPAPGCSPVPSPEPISIPAVWPRSSTTGSASSSAPPAAGRSANSPPTCPLLSWPNSSDCRSQPRRGGRPWPGATGPTTWPPAPPIMTADCQTCPLR
ncbi:hypothetical protein EST92_29040 [Streptomyces sp. TM32]|uniref:hypothetical protein n=1 Tax=Streptomyces sp. TM32 TaxID=1652669 RepID=UPI0010114022|nr:hypothetical protein [Streptomyces sp. TM32]RXS66147.1 hypothetical protein EST92_29040 [Streptomyces sp. TM32]